MTDGTERIRSLPLPEVEPTISVETAAWALGISRNSAYKAIRQGEIPALHIGKRVRIPTRAFREMLGLDGVMSS